METVAVAAYRPKRFQAFSFQAVAKKKAFKQ
jgi:hypothetical protein